MNKLIVRVKPLWDWPLNLSTRNTSTNRWQLSKTGSLLNQLMSLVNMLYRSEVPRRPLSVSPKQLLLAKCISSHEASTWLMLQFSGILTFWLWECLLFLNKAHCMILTHLVSLGHPFQVGYCHSWYLCGWRDGNGETQELVNTARNKQHSNTLKKYLTTSLM